MKKIKKIIPGLILLLCFFMANMGNVGLVLCLGENGHMAVEISHNNFCENYSPLNHGFNSFRKHKNHCVDFALSIDRLEQHIPSKSLETVITTPVFAVISEQFTPRFNRAGSDSFILPTTTKNTSIESLRTVVLLI